jgi:alpha-L-fucosidase
MSFFKKLLLPSKQKMKNLLKSILGLTLILLTLFSCQEESKPTATIPEVKIDYLNETPEAFDQRMKWWRDARFGLFVHWGAYAVPAGIYKGQEIGSVGEWIMKTGAIPINEYEAFAKQFNPTKFNAEEWVRIIKGAGMKYMVITSKHHDGFALWDSKVSTYDIVDFAPYGKDVLKALSDACKKEGIKFGLYHSIMDWHHPDAQANSYLKKKEEITADNFANFARYLEAYMKPQVKELIDNYEVDILWFDGEWVSEFTHDQGLELYQYVRSLKPDILINNRVDKGRQGMQGMNKDDGKYAGDFGTPEQEILENASDLDWESCMTMNDTWGFKSGDHNWKSGKVLIHNLIDVTAKGGNYLLNVGPTSEGLIPAPSVERLAQMGKWLSTNSEAIYKTEKLQNHYKQGDFIRFTKKKGESVYFGICLQSPKNEVSFTHLKPKEGSEVLILGYDQPLEWIYSQSDGLKINIPKSALSTIGETDAWVFKINGEETND